MRIPKLTLFGGGLHDIQKNLIRKMEWSPLFLFFLLLSPCVLPVELSGQCTANPNSISGIVFIDHDFDGILSNSDDYLGGIGISAYGENGLKISETVSSPVDGFVLTGLEDGKTYRIEFDIPESFQSGRRTISGTNIQFAKAPVCNLLFGLQQTLNFCEDVPQIGITCFVKGDFGINDVYPTIVGVTHNFNPDSQVSSYASKGETGSVWGLAWRQKSQEIFTSAFVKQFTGLTEHGPGAIFVTKITRSGERVTRLFVDLAKEGVDVGTLPNPDEQDCDFGTQVGKYGLGGLTISENEDVLYVINIYKNELIKIPVAFPDKDHIEIFPIEDPGCSDGEYRAFAIDQNGDKIYVGITCTAETSKKTFDSEAVIYEFDTETNSFTNIFSTNYIKGYWKDDQKQYLEIAHWFTDIAFTDEGNIVIGLTDRLGHIYCDGNGVDRMDQQSPDILVVWNDNGEWKLESNGSAGPLTGQGVGNGQGPGGGEFFSGEYWPTNPMLHPETALGSVFTYPGSGQVVAAVYDPIDEAYSGGILRFRTSDGEKLDSIQLYERSFNPQLGKATGFGDIDALCGAIPIEIGNLVWFDDNDNGIQDPGEPVLEGVQVSLYNENCELVGRDLTNSKGEYAFNESNVDLNNDGQMDGLEFEEDYFVVVDDPRFDRDIRFIEIGGTPYTLTLKDIGAAHAPDQTDSDASLDLKFCASIDGYPVVKIHTGVSGENDYDIDIGFTDSYIFDLALRKKNVKDDIVVLYQKVDFEIKVFNQGNVKASNIQLVDYLSEAFNFYVDDNPGWHQVDDSLYYAVPGTLSPGDSVGVYVRLELNEYATLENLGNIAEVYAANDPFGPVKKDIDSVFDNDPSNDNGVFPGLNIMDIGKNPSGSKVTSTDDWIHDDGTIDEDDHDISTIRILDLALIKQVANESQEFYAGNTIDYNIIVYNQGTEDVQDVQIIDYFPSELIFIEEENNGWYQDTDTTLMYQLPGILVSGEFISIPLKMNIDPDFQGGQVVNYAEVNHAVSVTGFFDRDYDSLPNHDANDDPGGEPDSETDDLITDHGKLDEDDHDGASAFVRSFDLAIEKSVQNTTYEGGDIVEFTIKITNEGSSPADDIWIYDYIPDEMTLADADWVEENDNHCDFVTASRVLSSENGGLPLLGLLPNEMATTTIKLRIRDDAAPGEIENWSEIAKVSNEIGSDISGLDKDSTPGNFCDNASQDDDDNAIINVVDVFTSACACKEDATCDLLGNFEETITIVGVTDKMWQVHGVPIGFYEIDGLSLMAANTVLVSEDDIPSTGLSTYTLTGWHKDGLGYEISFIDSDMGIVTVTSEGCAYERIKVTGPSAVCLDATEVYQVNGPAHGMYEWTLLDGGTIMQPANGNSVTVIWDELGGPFNLCVKDLSISCSAPEIMNVLVGVSSGAIVCEGPLNVSLGQDCSLEVFPDLVSAGTLTPDANYMVMLFDENGDLIEDNILTGMHVGQNITVKLIDDCSENSCWTTLRMEDKIIPEIDCPTIPIPISCTEMDDYLPEAIDNCDQEPKLVLVSESIIYDNCTEGLLRKINRSYKAVDNFGNSSAICNVELQIQQLDLTEIQFPDDFLIVDDRALTCNAYPVDEDGFPDPEATGVPTLNGEPLWPPVENDCQLFVYYHDELVLDNGCMKKFVREWTVYTGCTEYPDFKVDQQLFEVIDPFVPGIICPADVTVNTNTDNCEGEVALPFPTATDNCSNVFRYEVELPSGERTEFEGQSIELSEGYHHINFRAYDQCNNWSSCQVAIVVEDGTDPVPICEDQVSVRIGPNASEVKMWATALNVASYDNCELSNMLVRKNDNNCDCQLPYFDGFTYLGEYGGHHYYVSGEELKQKQAYNLANAYGGYVTQINNVNEGAWLESNVTAQIGLGQFWMDVVEESNGIPLIFQKGSLPVPGPGHSECLVQEKCVGHEAYPEHRFILEIEDPCGWSEKTMFCCAEAGTTQMTSLRVIDKWGNFTDCMVEVRVDTKAEPELLCEYPEPLFCDDDLDEAAITAHFEAFPPTVVSHHECAELGELIFEGFNIEFDDECGYGAVSGTWGYDKDGDGMSDIFCETGFLIGPRIPFDPRSIKWPPHYTGEAFIGINVECVDSERIETRKVRVDMNGHLDCSEANDLCQPEWTDPDCGLIGWSLSTDTIYFEQEVCVKVIKRWTVVDWCRWSPNDDHNDGLINDSEDDNDSSCEKFVAVEDWTLADVPANGVPGFDPENNCTDYSCFNDEENPIYFRYQDFFISEHDEISFGNVRNLFNPFLGENTFLTLDILQVLRNEVNSILNHLCLLANQPVAVHIAIIDGNNKVVKTLSVELGDAYSVYKFFSETVPSEVDAAGPGASSTFFDLQVWSVDVDGYYTFDQVIKIIDKTGPVIRDNPDLEACAIESCEADATITKSASDAGCATTLNWNVVVTNENGNVIHSQIFIATNNIEFDLISLEVGTYTIAYTVIDGCNNISKGEDVLTVSYCKPPIPTCIEKIAVSIAPMDVNGDGEPDIERACLIAEIFDASSVSLCDYPLVFSFSPDITDTIFCVDCTDIGLVDIEVWVTDSLGNQAFCEAQIDVQDNNDVDLCPSPKECINWPVEVLTITECVQDTLPVTLGSEATVDDDCPFCNDYEITYNDIVGGADPNGCSVIKRTWTVEFTCGEFDPCSFEQTITILNDNPPSITCPDDITADSDGMDCGAYVFIPIPVSISPCNTDVVITHDSEFADDPGEDASGRYPVGTTTVTFTATDRCGNITECEVDITVDDVDPPVCESKDITVEIDGTGKVSIIAMDLNDGSMDLCDSFELEYAVDIDTFFCTDLGDQLVILTVTDTKGNASSCEATVTVEENFTPTCVPRDITISLDASGNASIQASDVDGGSLDECSNEMLTLSLSKMAFTCQDVGVDSVTLVVMDGNGNSDECKAGVTVIDEVAPVCEASDITVEITDEGFVVLDPELIGSASTDACGMITEYSVEPDTFYCEDLGLQVVTLTVTDESGNSSECNANITVEEDFTPTCVPKDITILLDENGNASIQASDVDGGSLDECSDEMLMLSIDKMAFTCIDIGVDSITLTVTDGKGNSDDCKAGVTVIDEVAPVCVANDITVEITDEGFVVLDPEVIGSGSTDACGMITEYSVEPDTFYCEDLGLQVVTLTVTDESGNSSECNANITVEEDFTPTCVPKDITILLDENGNASIQASDVDGGSLDECSDEMLMLSIDKMAFTCIDIGVDSVTLTVTDGKGNSDECKAGVTVLDEVAPECVAVDLTVSITDEGFVVLDPMVIGGTSSDACGMITDLVVDPDTLYCDDLGLNIVTLTVTDERGNSSECMANITVEESLNPICVPKDITVSLDATGNVSIIASDVDGGSIDDCSGNTVSLSVDKTDFTCEDIGKVTVTLKVTDNENNMSTCDAEVTVVDEFMPVCLAQDITVYLGDEGHTVLDPDEIDNGSSDACGMIIEKSVNPDTLFCMDLGPNDVTLTVTDNSMNMASCESVVTLLDTLAPICIAKDITVQLDEDGQVIVSPFDADGGSIDECGTTIDFNITPTTFFCNDVGTRTYTLTVTDTQGNSSSCVGNVTIEDVTAPRLTCPDDITIGCEDPIDDLSLYGIPEVEEECAFAQPTEDVFKNINSCNIGIITRMFKISDVSGNMSECTQIITIEGPDDPILESDITFPSPMIELTDCTDIDPDTIDSGVPVVDIAAADCAIISIDYSDNITSPQGVCPLVVEREWTVIDSCQLTGDNQTGIFKFIQTITITDLTDPVLTVPEDVVISLSPGVCDTMLTNLVSVAEDCDMNLTFTNDSPYADDNNSADASGIYPIGDTKVVVTVTDNCGNSAIDSFRVQITPTPTSDYSCMKSVNNITDAGTVEVPISRSVTITQSGCNLDSIFAAYSRTDITDTIAVFDCDQIGDVSTAIWFYQNNEVFDSCLILITVQDQFGLCLGVQGLADIGGLIQTEAGFGVPGVEVALAGSRAPSQNTDQFGNYAFETMQKGSDYTVKPSRQLDVNNGVSTLDLILVQKHILGSQILDSPYKIIAADINRSNSVTVTDMLELRKLILGVQDEFTQNTSWRMVDAGYSFYDPKQPLNEPFPEEYDIKNLTGNMFVDFIGVKIGDVNNSVKLEGFDEVEIRTDENLEFSMIAEQQGDNAVKYRIRANNFDEVLGFQFTLSFDPAILEFADIQAIGLPIARENIGLRYESIGLISFSYNASAAMSIDPQNILFDLVFTNRSQHLPGIQINSEITRAEAYRNNDILGISLQEFNINEFSDEARLLQNVPNPWSHETNIGFYLPETSSISIKFYDISGRLIKEVEGRFEKGEQELRVDKDDLNTSGLIYYELRTPNAQLMRKMLILN